MHKNLEVIFNQAIEIESLDEQAKFLDRKCQGRPNLRDRVDQLLSAHKSASVFLEQSPRLDLPDDNAPTVDSPLSGSAADDQTLPPNLHSHDAKHIDTFDHPEPRRFGDYNLLEKIAKGGMGVVYKAHQLSLNRTVAVKMILTGEFAGKEEIQRFYREAEAAAQLNHPGIVPVYDVGCCDGHHYFSMGLVDGVSLADHLKQGAMPIRSAADMVKKIAMAMQAAHEKGVIHRDLKPGNVLLDQNHEPKVTDFGLAKRVEDDSHLTATGMVMGTPSYMPPEQATGKKIDEAADVYSLGAILYAALTGKPPFEGNTQVETLMQVVQDEPVLVRRHNPRIPKDLEVICMKCLEKKPEDRYGSAEAMARDLDRFLAGEPIAAKDDLIRRFRKWTIREPVLAAQLTTTFALMFIIAINFLIFGHRGIRAENLRQLINLELILVVSALFAFALQKTKNRLQRSSWLSIVWASINPVFVTLAIYVSPPPRDILFSIYLLLMITICFFRRVDLVIVTTLSSLIGYVIILATCEEGRIISSSYQMTFGLTLIVSGILSGFIAFRMQRLGLKKSEPQN